MKDVKVRTQTINIDEIVLPDCDMKYRKITVQLIKYFDTLIRGSYEYKFFIHFLKNVLDVNRCAFYEGYNMENGFTIELHHSPFTLFDICESVAKKHFAINDGYVETFPVCEEVSRLHYEFKVGLVPLNPTAHELVHSGNLDIHPDIVMGDWRAFEKEYRSYLSEEVKVKLFNIEELIKKDYKEFPKILEKNEIKLNIPQIENISKFNIDKFMIQEKMKQLTDK